MYEKIVVPLDGSKLAECVLPHVEELAKGCGTQEVILVTVTERIVGSMHVAQYTQLVGPLPPPEPVTKVPVAIGKKQRCLNRIAKGLQKEGIKVCIEVLPRLL